MQTISLTSIKKEFTVETTQERAFKVFTEKMDLWWPRQHHIGSTAMTEMVVEPYVNGRWYSKHTDGSEANVGRVLTYQPYDLFVLAWQIDGNFKCDPNLVTEVVVAFIPEGPKTTRVKFEHKDLQKLADGTKVIESMDEGWGMIMEQYKNITEK
ncbi:SRPBCC family protein [Mucilaginibacter sp. UYCu711]|uniref:SRPBCC family protein n=1 Tax=Mucilaginibacter sp. UYCu711 TaxID=3156339 RepID=UPI003D19D97D